MAKVIAGVGTSHIPAIGAAVDHNKTQEAYWKPVFEGMEPAKKWIEETKPDVCIVVFNDHASAFSLEATSTFAIGVAPEFQPADEGYGPRKVPVVKGSPELAWHITESLIMDEFDMTIVNEMPVDHGLTVPLSIMYGQPEEWPCEVIPLCVNVIQYPQPTGNRCFNLGKAIRKAVESYPKDTKVAIFGTGGLSHQLQGERAGLINAEYDEQWLDDLVAAPEKIKHTSHTEYLRETGSEGIEAIMWLIMRGALDEDVKQVYRFTHCPVSNTHYGLLVLENQDE
ncbi:class III extradiol dioxygenase subunit beta [Marinomonas pollencensis]|uniref:Protocatechuate 4,5-dioxygenase beta subunit n=1 Tax=Marinomonas pollencensis TaxID=491954 RepID=A0A3E0DP13_9GAMM|nr:class III extradiol dioxygenase subunit beta [Marinomonas pollencensis]REG83218.1 protocatechuate 4,5-dioxygenase beta subunit [Marinomonas pollencensis]